MVGSAEGGWVEDRGAVPAAGCSALGTALDVCELCGVACWRWKAGGPEEYDCGLSRYGCCCCWRYCGVYGDCSGGALEGMWKSTDCLCVWFLRGVLKACESGGMGAEAEGG